MKQLIEDTEKAVIELSEKIDELEEKTRTLEEEAEQVKIQLLKQKTDKDKLQLKVDQTQKEKEVLQSILETDRRQFQKDIEKMTFELKLQEVLTIHPQ